MRLKFHKEKISPFFRLGVDGRYIPGLAFIFHLYIGRWMLSLYCITGK